MTSRSRRMSAAEAAQVLDVAPGADWHDVRVAFRRQIRSHHPDHAGDASAAQAAQIIEAFRTLDPGRTRPPPSSDQSRTAGTDGSPAAEPPPPVTARPRWASPEHGAPPVARLDADTIAVAAPADETFRWLVEAANDIGEITYLDRSGPILEVLCRFEGEPATSLMITLQGRADGTEAFCTVDSIEARPAPPAEAVVDLLELALRRRRQ